MTQLLFKNIFVVLHVITAAGWFGLGLNLTRQARTVAALDPSSARPFIEDRLSSVRLMGIMIVLTFIFGLGAMFSGGGFGAYGAQYHTSMLLILLLIAIHYALIYPAWRGLERAFSTTSRVLSDSDGYRKRIAMGMGLGHLIWLVVLILMFWNQIRIAL